MSLRIKRKLVVAIGEEDGGMGQVGEGGGEVQTSSYFVSHGNGSSA